MAVDKQGIEISEFNPDGDNAIGSTGERGTSALPVGHEGRRGLDVERAVEYPGAEKFTSDVVIDGVYTRGRAVNGDDPNPAPLKS